MTTAGQITAAAIACASIHASPVKTSRPGVWNSSRIAPAVEEIGFQAATVPSQVGMSVGGVNTEEMKAKGNATAKRLPALSLVLIRNPSQMPTKISDTRNHSSSTKASRVAPKLPPERHPTANAIPAMTSMSTTARMMSRHCGRSPLQTRTWASSGTGR